MKLENVPVNPDTPEQNVMSVSRDTLKHLMELVKVRIYFEMFNSLF